MEEEEVVDGKRSGRRGKEGGGGQGSTNLHTQRVKDTWVPSCSLPKVVIAINACDVYAYFFSSCAL